MIEFSIEEINIAYEKTSPQIQEVLNSDWLTNDLANLSKNVQINIAQTSALINLVGYFLLNLIPLSKLIYSLEENLEIDSKRSAEISKKLDQDIFSKVRLNVTQMQEELKRPLQEIIEREKKLTLENNSKDDNLTSLRVTNNNQETETETETETNREEEFLRESLLKDIEDYSEEVVEKNMEKSEEKIPNKLKKIVSNNLTEKKVDPYREQL